MKLKVQIATKVLKRRLKAWEKRVDDAQLGDLKAYCKDYAARAIKECPPGNGRISYAKAAALAKKRIKTEFEGGGADVFDDDDLRWYHEDGKLVCRFNGKARRDKRVGPFRVYKGRPSAKKLAAMRVGRHEVLHVQGSLQRFVKARPEQYSWVKRGKQIGLRWRGVRHVLSLQELRREIKRRQNNVGKLVAGWIELAEFGGVRMPAAGKKHGRGNSVAKVRKSKQHKMVMEAKNTAGHPDLQGIVDKGLPAANKRFKRIQKKRIKLLDLDKVA